MLTMRTCLTSFTLSQPLCMDTKCCDSFINDFHSNEKESNERNKTRPKENKSAEEGKKMYIKARLLQTAVIIHVKQN